MASAVLYGGGEGALFRDTVAEARPLDAHVCVFLARISVYPRRGP